VQHVYSRSSTASQSLLRQRHILTEAGLLVRGEDVTVYVDKSSASPILAAAGCSSACAASGGECHALER
jgi:hypothetical protein